MPNLYVDHVNGDNNSTIYIHDAELRNTLGQANGIATLDNTGKLPTSQLPNSVNNKLEASTLASESETEATTTATMAHAKDSKFYLAATGEYCMAKTAIAIGDTLVKDTNYQVISINGFLTNLESYLILAGQILDTKADKSEMSVTPGIGTDADKTTIQLKSGTSATVLTTHQDISGKVDKVTGKQLSTEDYTTADKTKLSGISTGANKTEASTTNGNVKIDNVETPVYRNYGNNTVLTTDETPFLTRQTLNPTGFSGYVREKLIGASYAWNQLVQNGNFATTGSGWTTIRGSLSVSNNVGTFTSGAGSDNALRNVLTDYYIAGHKYLISFKYKSNVAFDFQPPVKADVVHCGITSNWTTVILLVTNSTYAVALNTAYWYNYDSLTASAWVLQLMEYQAIDLTLAFGSTIADYLYSLTNNGGITKLRDMGFPIDKYTPYGYGLYSVKTSGKKIVGKNLVGEIIHGKVLHFSTGLPVDNANYCITDYIAIRPNLTLVFSNTATGGENWIYDMSKNPVRVLELPSTTPRTVTFTENGYIRCSALNNEQVQIEIGSTPTTYEEPSITTYSLGNDELRGKFDLVNGEIVVSGDVKESNGEIDRVYGIVDLGSINWNSGSYGGTAGKYTDAVTTIKLPTYGTTPNMVSTKYVPCGCTGALYTAAPDNSITCESGQPRLWVKTTDTPSGYLIYELATPTTEQSTPFADPMSLVGATTEEYIDDRDIPCPVGAERQYMGQSEDVVEIPSSPLSDGKRKLVAETSGGKTQYYFEDDKNGAGTQVNLMTYNTSTNKYVCPSDGYISLSNAGASVGDYIIMSVYGANDNLICGLRCDTSVASIVTVQNLFVKRGMKCYVRATSSTGSFTALFTPLS